MHPPRCSIVSAEFTVSKPLRGRFASLDTAATARGTAAIEEDGGGAGHGHQRRPDHGSPGHQRAINPGDERSLTVTRGHPAPQVGPHNGPDGTDSQADSVAKPVATEPLARPVRADAGLAARSWIGAIGPDTRRCRDSSCVKYVRNPGAPAAFALVTALRGRVCKTIPFDTSASRHA